MELHQINLNYLQQEDRLLCRASFRSDDGLQEIRAWLTRRTVRDLWLMIVKALETQVTLDKPQAAHARTEIVGMQHASSLEQGRQDGSFASTYDSGATAFPLGQDPFLVAKLTLNLRAGQPIRVDLAPADGQGFEMALPPAALHGFCSVLIEAVAKADWALDLRMPGLQAPDAGSPTLN